MQNSDVIKSETIDMIDDIILKKRDTQVLLRMISLNNKIIGDIFSLH